MSYRSAQRSDCSTHIVSRLCSFHEGKAAFDAGDASVQILGLVRTVYHSGRPVVEDHDGPVTRMKHQAPQALFQAFDLSAKKFVVHAKLFFRQPIDIIALVLDPLHLQAKQGVQIILPVRASSAHTLLFVPLMYITPSTTRGVVS